MPVHAYPHARTHTHAHTHIHPQHRTTPNRTAFFILYHGSNGSISHHGESPLEDELGECGGDHMLVLTPP